MSWTFDFTKNAHMYCHHLKCRRANTEFSCPSENSAQESNVILFWVDDLPIEGDDIVDFSAQLNNWALKQGFEFRIYFNNQSIFTNVA